MAIESRNPAEERERVERWLEARTQAITFKNAVGRELDRAEVAYRRDVCEGIASVDFLIEGAGKRVGIETKFNVGRDFEKTVGVARRLRELLRCDLVIIAVPFEGEFAVAADAEARPSACLRQQMRRAKPHDKPGNLKIQKSTCQPTKQAPPHLRPHFRALPHLPEATFVRELRAP